MPEVTPRNIRFMQLLFCISILCLGACTSNYGFSVSRSFSSSLSGHHGYQIQAIEAASGRLMQAAEQQLTEEMSERGYANAVKPEFLVRYYLVSTDGNAARRREVINTAYRSTRRDGGDNVPGPTPALQAIKAGGVAVMIVDARTGELLWERVAQVKEIKSEPDARRAQVRQMIIALMEDLPPRDR